MSTGARYLDATPTLPRESLNQDDHPWRHRLDRITISLMKKMTPQKRQGFSVWPFFRGRIKTSAWTIEKMFYKLSVELPGIAFLAEEGSTLLGVMRMRSCDGRKAPENSEGPPDQNDLKRRKTAWLKEWVRHVPLDQLRLPGPIGVLPLTSRIREVLEEAGL